MAWDHEAVFDALERKFGRNTSEDSPLTWLYEQQSDCAVLYAPHSKTFRRYPLHLYPGRDSWKPDVYKAILPFIALGQLEKKSDKKRAFLLFSVEDWPGFAKALRL